jgi:hypothetical protein
MAKYARRGRLTSLEAHLPQAHQRDQIVDSAKVAQSIPLLSVQVSFRSDGTQPAARSRARFLTVLLRSSAGLSELTRVRSTAEASQTTVTRLCRQCGISFFIASSPDLAIAGTRGAALPSSAASLPPLPGSTWLPSPLALALLHSHSAPSPLSRLASRHGRRKRAAKTAMHCASSFRLLLRVSSPLPIPSTPYSINTQKCAPIRTDKLDDVARVGTSDGRLSRATGRCASRHGRSGAGRVEGWRKAFPCGSPRFRALFAPDSIRPTHPVLGALCRMVPPLSWCRTTSAGAQTSCA